MFSLSLSLSLSLSFKSRDENRGTRVNDKRTTSLDHESLSRSLSLFTFLGDVSRQLFDVFFFVKISPRTAFGERKRKRNN